MPLANVSETRPDQVRQYIEFKQQDDMSVSQSRSSLFGRSGDWSPSYTELLRSNRATRIQNYIQKAQKQGFLSPKTTQIALNVLSEVYQRKSLLLPDASYNEEGLFLFFWSKGDHYLEMEIDTEQKVYFFYQDKRTLSMAGVDYTPGSPIPCEVLKAWRLFEE